MKVFISHSHETEALAEKVGEALERAGLTAWILEQEIQPGDNWARKIADALEESQAMVVLISRDSLQSTMVHHEALQKSTNTGPCGF